MSATRSPSTRRRVLAPARCRSTACRRGGRARIPGPCDGGRPNTRRMPTITHLRTHKGMLAFAMPPEFTRAQVEAIAALANLELEPTKSRCSRGSSATSSPTPRRCKQVDTTGVPPTAYGVGTAERRIGRRVVPSLDDRRRPRQRAGARAAAARRRLLQGAPSHRMTSPANGLGAPRRRPAPARAPPSTSAAGPRSHRRRGPDR